MSFRDKWNQPATKTDWVIMMAIFVAAFAALVLFVPR